MAGMWYGVCAVGGALVCLAGGCAHPVAEQLRSGAETGAVPPDIVVTYDDYDPKWGGRRIRVQGGGRVAVRRFRPGQAPEDAAVWHGRVTPREVEELVDLLVQIEAWEQRIEPRSQAARLDDARATLAIRAGEEGVRVWEWANDLETNGRLVLVRDRLEAMVRDATPARAGQADR